MEFTQLIVLSVVQAVSEVLPVGAAGHNALIERASGWSAGESGLDLPVRVGLLLAILSYFWRDVADMIGGLMRAAKGKRNPDARLAAQIAVATIPTLGLGFAFKLYVAGDWQTAHVMGWGILAVAVLLFFFDRMSMTVNRIEHTGFGSALAISLCQVIALIPGIGASAMMFLMARFLGYERQAAVRLSFLLMAPVLAAVAIRQEYVRVMAQQASFTYTDAINTTAAYVAALITLAVLMIWVRRGTFTLFVVYRALIGIAVLVLTYELIAL